MFCSRLHIPIISIYSKLLYKTCLKFPFHNFTSIPLYYNFKQNVQLKNGYQYQFINEIEMVTLTSDGHSSLGPPRSPNRTNVSNVTRQPAAGS